MMPAISSEPKARSVLLRMLPAELTWSKAATPASSSGKSATQTMSYSPQVRSSSRTLPPELWTSLANSSARCVVSRKFLTPCSVQLIKDTYVVMLAPPGLRNVHLVVPRSSPAKRTDRPCADPGGAIRELPVLRRRWIYGWRVGWNTSYHRGQGHGS